MRGFTAWLVGIGILICLSQATAVAGGVNLVKNGGFEAGFTDWDVWYNPGVWSIASDDPYAGSKYARFERGSTGYTDSAMESSNILLLGGVTYQIEIAIRDVNTRDTFDSWETIIDLGLRPAAGGKTLWAGFTNTPKTSDWQHLKGYYTPTADVVVDLDLQVHGHTTALPGFAGVDSVSITAVPLPGGLVAGASLLTALGLFRLRRRFRTPR